MKNRSLHTLILCLLTSFLFAQNPPNILWITCEDISPYLAAYGDSTIVTPNIDRLAREGVVYENMFATVGVCAPARSSIITGMYPVSIGTHNMRTGMDIRGYGKRIYKENVGVKDREGNNVPQYSAVIPSIVKCFTEYLRSAGYFCTNNSKTDYQFAAPLTAWDECSGTAHWRNRPSDVPFFSVFNLGSTHESQLWIGWDNKKKDLLVDLDETTVPPYLFDNDSIRTDIARNYSNISLMDQQVGRLLDQLEEDGLLENTYVFFYSDHGGPLPRGKRQIYDSGLKVPLLIRFPNGEMAGYRDKELHSFVDLAPSVLSIAGIEIPNYMQGYAFLGEARSSRPREFIYGTKDRMDERNEMVRIVRSMRLLYVKNYIPKQAAYLDISYRKQLISMREMLRLLDEDQLSDSQKTWFMPDRPIEELYDVVKDPMQLYNLAADPNYKDTIMLMRKELETWQSEVSDKGFIPEAQLVAQMWPDFEQPITARPVYTIDRDTTARLFCPTEGASIAYQFSQTGTSSPWSKDWKLYTEPIKLQKGVLHVRAIRIGFRDSEELVIQQGEAHYVSSTPIQ